MRPGSGAIPPCADPGFDHRTCDYWEDADRGSKAARLAWLEPPRPGPATGAAASRTAVDNPFLAERPRGPGRQPVRRRVRGRRSATRSSTMTRTTPRTRSRPPRRRGAAVETGAPRKLQLLARGLGRRRALREGPLRDDAPAAYCQFGPLTAYPRAQRTRDLYPQLPGLAAPRGHHLHRDDRRGTRRPGSACAWSGRLRRPRGARVRRRRGLPGGDGTTRRDERRDARVLGGGRLRARRRRPAVPGHAPRARVSAATRPSIASWSPSLGLVAACGTSDHRPASPSAIAPAPTPGGRDRRPGDHAARVRAHRRRPRRPPARSSSTRRLLDVLPPTVDGRRDGARSRRPPRRSSARPTSSASASAIAIGRYVGAGDSGGDDIAVASVVAAPPGRLQRRVLRDVAAATTTSPPASRPAASAAPRPRSTIGSFAVHVGTSARRRDDLSRPCSTATPRLGPSPSGRATLGEHVVAGLRAVTARCD